MRKKNKEKIEDLAHPDEQFIEDRQYWFNKIKTFANLKFSKNRVPLFKYAPDIIKKDREIVMESILNSEYFHEIDNSLQYDKNFILEYIKKTEKYVFYISFPDELKLDEDILNKSLEKDYTIFPYIPFSKQRDRDFVLSCLEKNGLIYEKIPSFFKKDIELAQVAFKQNMNSIKFMSKGVINKFFKNVDVAKELLEKDIAYFEHLPIKIKNDKEFITPYILKNPYIISFLTKKVLSDVDFVESFYNKDYSFGITKNLIINQLFIYAYFKKSNILNNPEIALKAIKVAENNYNYIGKNLREDINFNLKAMKENRHIYSYLPENYKENINILVELFSEPKICVRKNVGLKPDEYRWVSEIIPKTILKKYLDEEYQNLYSNHVHDTNIYKTLKAMIMEEKLSIDFNEKKVDKKPALKI